MHLHAPLRLSTLAVVIILLIVLARMSSAQPGAAAPSQAAPPSKAAPPAAAPPPRNKAAAPAPGALASTPSVPSATLLAPAPLSDAERIHLRTAQVRSLRSQSLRVCTSIAELAQSPEWQEAQQADAAFRAAIDAIYAARHIDPADAVLCDGPGQGAAANPACAGLAKDVLEIRAVVRPSALGGK